MSNTRRVFEWTVNAICVAAIAYAAVGAASRYTARPPAPAGPGGYLEGLPLPTARKSLVMFLSTTCGFCTASADFYRTLLRANGSGGAYVVAVFPQERNAAAAYLNDLRVPVGDIRQSGLRALAVEGTPTLMLVAADRRIERVWTGRLSGKGEDEVFSALGLTREAARANPPLPLPQVDVELTLENMPSAAAADLRDALSADGDVPIVDLRPRDAFRRGRIVSAVNIPVEELRARAPHELPAHRPIFVYCSYLAECDQRLAVGTRSSRCETGLEMLLTMGFKDARVINADLAGLRGAGLAVAGDEEQVREPASGRLR